MAETGVERQAGIWSASGKFMRFAAMAGALLVAGCQSIIPKGAPTRPEIPTTTPTPVQPGLPTDTERHRIALLVPMRSEEHTSELQSLMRISYAVFCLTKKKQNNNHNYHSVYQN